MRDAGAADRQAPRRASRARSARPPIRARRATTRTCATRAAACSRPAARSRTRSRAGACRCCGRRLLDRADDAARRAAPPPRRAGPVARRPRRLQHARHHAAAATWAACRLAGACGAVGRRPRRARSPPTRVVLAGVRDLDDGERELLERSEATVIGASVVETLVAVKNALDGAPVYVHLDLDVLDPEASRRRVPRARRAAPGEALRPDRGRGRRLRAGRDRGHGVRGAGRPRRAAARRVAMSVLDPLLADRSRSQE